MRFFLLLLLLTSILKCSSSGEKSKVTEIPKPQNQELDIVNSDLDTPKRIKGEIAVFKKGEDTQKAILSYIADNKAIYNLADPVIELSVTSNTTDDLGFRHILLHRRHNSIPIWGDELLFHINAENVLYLYSGHYHPSLSADFTTQPTLTAKQAEAAAAAALSLSIYEARETSLIIHFSSASPLLAYHLIIGKSARSVDQWECIINAHNGDLLTKSSLIRP